MNGDSTRRPVNGNDPDVLGRLPQPRIGEKVFDGFRDAAVAIFRLGPNRGQSLFIARGRNALVSPQALSHVADIRFGNRDIDGEIDGDAGFVFDLFAAELRNRALEHLRVEIESERVHVTGLLPAQQIARTPQFQIQSRDPKSSSQFRKLTNRGQTPCAQLAKAPVPPESKGRHKLDDSSARRARATDKAEKDRNYRRDL